LLIPSAIVVDRYRAFNGTCRESAVSHFQSWKQNYLLSTTRAPPLDAHAVVLSEFGFVPYKLPRPPTLVHTRQLQQPLTSESGTKNMGRISAASIQQQNRLAKNAKSFYELNPEAYAIKSFGELLESQGNTDMIDAGKLTVADIEAVSTKLQLFAAADVGTRNSSASPLLQSDYATIYCGAFSSDLKKCVCAIMYEHFDIIQVASNYNSHRDGKKSMIINSDVTFITAAWAPDFYSGGLDAMIEAWGSSQKVNSHFSYTFNLFSNGVFRSLC
jgi:hypothetical protein